MKSRYVACCAVLFLLFLFAASAQADVSLDFEGGISGFTQSGSCRLVQSPIAYSGTYSLGVENRGQNDYDAADYPMASLDLLPGDTVTLSFYAYHEGIDAGIIKAGLGSGSYAELARATVEPKTWTQITGTFTVAELTNLRFQTYGVNMNGVSFYVDEVKVMKKRQKYPSGLPSLKEKYSENFLMGCAVGQSQLANRERMDFLAAQFSSFTPENELKPENVFDAAKSREMAQNGDNTHPAVKFDAARPLLEYAKANKIAVHGHVLVWHSQTPKSFFTEDYTDDGKLAGRETMLARLENYIAAVMKYLEENYRGAVLSWDVVNEAVLDGSGKLRGKKTVDDKNGTYWMDTVGEDYILQAFTIARKYAPEGTKLFYNDYSVPYVPKLTGIKAIMGELMKAGVVDGIGFQAHYQLKTPSKKQISDAMAYFAGQGLSIRVSELDIPIPANTSEALLSQAERYQSLMEVFLGFSDAIDAVTVWGTSDDLSWKREGFPLLFDQDLAPKPAFWAWADPTQLPAEKPNENQERPSGALNKPCAEATMGKPDMLGKALDPLWETAASFPMTATLSENADEDGKVKASFRVLWQPDMLYVLADITDPYLDDSNVNTYMQDSIEVFVDEGNHRTGTYEDDDGQYRVNFKNVLTIDHGTVTPVSRAFVKDMGFAVEIAIPFTASMEQGNVLGFDVRYNNAALGGRRTLLNFCDESDTGWNDTTVFGLLELK
jgi:endo-1,4-beta-xylanase